jgi:predicted MFS family arabinose efflux permease
MPLGPDLETALHLTPKQFGWLVSVYGFAASASGLLAATVLDRFDRKNALLVLYAGFLAGTLLCGVAPGYGLLTLGRAAAGGFAGVLAALVLAAVGDAFPESRRATAMGVVMAAFSLASVAGVPAGLALAHQFNWRAPFLILVGLGVVVLGVAWALLPAMRAHLDRPNAQRLRLGEVLLHPSHVRAYAFTASLVVGSFTIVPYLSLYLVNNVGMDRADLPYVWLFGGATTLVTMPLCGRLADRFGKLRVFRIVALAAIVPVLWLTNLPPVPLAVALAATTLFMVMTSGRMAPAMALITGSARPENRGRFLSVNASEQQMAAGVAPLLAGLFLGDARGGEPLAGFAWAGVLGASSMVVSLALAGTLPRPGQEVVSDPEPVSPSADLALLPVSVD